MARKNKKCVFFISTPTHGNLGDQAIVYAQYQLIGDIGGKKNIVEITRAGYEHLNKRLVRIIRADDIIIIDGGGNIGTLWIQEEYKMRDIIQRFPKNPIFIFPQTAFFSDDEKGQIELRQSIEVYGEHKNLTIFCRDQGTYELISQKFVGVKSFYTPDIVPYITNASQKEQRDKCFLILRKDLEGVCTKQLDENLKKYLHDKGCEVFDNSTLVAENVTKRAREKYLYKKWREFSSARLVITDRLHGMLFCAITGTPCIALDNLSHKVRDGYVWIQRLPYIEFCSNEDEVYDKVEFMWKQNKTYHYTRELLDSHYEIIKEEVGHAFN